MKKKLAIVIPAYKADYLSATLESIASQSVADFCVYIGDDASPYELEAIVSAFSERIPIVYQRFTDNFGGKDLVAQWERCIGMVQNEDWIWLFSDDDIMPEDAVARFYQSCEQYPDNEFFRFPLCRIDGDGKIEYQCKPLPEGVSSAETLLTDYLAGKRPSAACEYIFSKNIFEARKMVHFPLAWCSDTATWYDYAQAGKGVVNLAGKAVEWRNVAGSNISNTSGLQAQKMEALIGFVKWLQVHYAGKKNRTFSKALRCFIKTNLTISFEGIYEAKALRELCQAYAYFGCFSAWTLHRKYRKKI
jgi:glycosyltransferase involved in cell wall biosynthesis